MNLEDMINLAIYKGHHSSIWRGCKTDVFYYNNDIHIVIKDVMK